MDDSLEGYEFFIDNGLLGAAEGLVHVWTGIASGPVAVRVRVLEHGPPALDTRGWEEVAEASARFPSGRAGIALVSRGGDALASLAVPTSWMRVRVSTSGRTRHPSEDVEESRESFLVELWTALRSEAVEHTAMLR